MKSTKVAFFGTSDKSGPILDILHKNFNLALCVTKSDTKVGRKQIQKETFVKSWAKKNNVAYITIESLKGQDLALITGTLIKKQVSLGVVADFNYIIPIKLLSTVPNGLINVHFSLLPKYRGASPVQHTILNGDTKTGVTYQLMDKNMDTGDIIHQFEHKLTGKENTQSLYTKLFDLAALELPKVIKGYLDGTYSPQKQKHDAATYCYSPSHPKSTYIYKEDARIDWTQGAKKIDQAVRAYFPWPVAWTTLRELEKAPLPRPFNSKNKNKDLKVKIFEVELSKNEELRTEVPSLLARNKKTLLEIKKLQVEGKKITDWKSFTNGYGQI